MWSFCRGLGHRWDREQVPSASISSSLHKGRRAVTELGKRCFWCLSTYCTFVPVKRGSWYTPDEGFTQILVFCRTREHQTHILGLTFHTLMTVRILVQFLLVSICSVDCKIDCCMMNKQTFFESKTGCSCYWKREKNVRLRHPRTLAFILLLSFSLYPATNIPDYLLDF